MFNLLFYLFNLQPTLSLRTSAHLLLGLVKIHSRKAKYLLVDCKETLAKTKLAFRPDYDLPGKSCVAALNAVTLPDNLLDFDPTIADLT